MCFPVTFGKFSRAPFYRATLLAASGPKKGLESL